MKLFYIILAVSSFSAFSNMDGIWSLSGAGCRDSSLDPQTHRSKSLSKGHLKIKTGLVRLFPSGIIKLTAIREKSSGELEIKTQRGLYSVDKTRLKILGTKAIVEVQGDNLIVIGSTKETTEVCCNTKYEKEWKDYKDEVDQAKGSHPDGKNWEEIKQKKDWDNIKLLDNKSEWDEAVKQCKKDGHRFIYILGKI